MCPQEMITIKYIAPADSTSPYEVDDDDDDDNRPSTPYLTSDHERSSPPLLAQENDAETENEWSEPASSDSDMDSDPTCDAAAMLTPTSASSLYDPAIWEVARSICQLDGVVGENVFILYCEQCGQRLGIIYLTDVVDHKDECPECNTITTAIRVQSSAYRPDQLPTMNVEALTAWLDMRESEADLN